MSKLTPNQVISMCRQGSPKCNYANKLATVRHYLPGISTGQVKKWGADTLLQLLAQPRLDVRLVYIRQQLGLIDQDDAIKLIQKHLQKGSIYYQGQKLSKAIIDDIDEFIADELGEEIELASESNWGEADFYEDIASQISTDYEEALLNDRYVVFLGDSGLFRLTNKTKPTDLIVIDKQNNPQGAKIINSAISNAVEETWREFKDEQD